MRTQPLYGPRVNRRPGSTRGVKAGWAELAITDRAVSLWQLKLGGHLLDPDGRRLRSIPLQLWPDQPAAQAQTAIVDRLRRSP